MDSRLYETPQVLDQAESSTRKDTDRRKATDIAGEMNISVQRLTEEIENLRKTPSGDWSPGMHKSFADYHEKLLKYLVAIGALKTVSGETQLDYEKFVKEMGIINESRNNSDGEEKAETEAKTDDTSQNSKPDGTSGVASRNDSGDGSSSGDDGPKENPS